MALSAEKKKVQRETPKAELKFGKSFTYTEKDELSGKQTGKFSITFLTHSSASGRLIPEDMKEIEVQVSIKNISTEKGNLKIGPVEIKDDKGESHRGIVYTGPVNLFSGPFGPSYMRIEYTGNSEVTLTFEPNETIDEPPLFLCIRLPKNVTPVELSVILGGKETKRLHLR